jgi:DNA-binding IclR family transcriptional regulator
VDRALAVLCTFSPESPSLGITEISAHLGLTKSTVHRLLQTLVARGMVAHDPTQHSYTLGYRVLALAQAVPGEATLRQICRPHMQWLRSVTQETIGLYVVAGDVRMCLDEIESPQVLRMAAGVGRCFPLAAGAPSKALLADGLAHGDLWRRVAASLSDDHRARLLREVDELHRRGFASSCGETVPGSASIAAPIRGADGAIVAALSVAGPASRFDSPTIARYGAALLQGTARIARDLVAADMLPPPSARHTQSGPAPG